MKVLGESRQMCWAGGMRCVCVTGNVCYGVRNKVWFGGLSLVWVHRRQRRTVGFYERVAERPSCVA